MKNDNSMDYIYDLLMEDDHEGAFETFLVEGEEERIVRSMGGETTLMNYLMKFEEYLDEHDVYLFDGWEDAEILAPPLVEKFWCNFLLRTKKGTDLRGALRVVNDKEGQNQVKYKKLEDGRHVLKFRILKRYLDQIEARNKERSDQLSDKKLEEL